MTDRDDPFASASAVTAAFRAGRVSAESLFETHIARAEALNDRAKALILPTPERARADAKALDQALARGQDPGPLAAAPFVSKDLIDIAGLPTSVGANGYSQGPASADALIVRSLQTAGAISLGKANLHAFAYGATGENADYGTAVNAYDARCLAGGSSSGSAAAVAFGLAAFALGTDTGGSVRAPAALSGLVGLKPTYGRVSCRGILPFSWSLDHVGWICAACEIRPCCCKSCRLRSGRPSQRANPGRRLSDPARLPCRPDRADHRRLSRLLLRARGS